jgi:hypothetical protein
MPTPQSRKVFHALYRLQRFSQGGDRRQLLLMQEAGDELVLSALRFLR